MLWVCVIETGERGGDVSSCSRTASEMGTRSLSALLSLATPQWDQISKANAVKKLSVMTAEMPSLAAAVPTQECTILIVTPSTRIFGSTMSRIMNWQIQSSSLFSKGVDDEFISLEWL